MSRKQARDALPLIIFRYLGRQALQVMAAVTVILLFVSVTSRFLQYLDSVVAGRLTVDILVMLLVSRLPEFLMIIVPLAFFLGILLAYGRMYADNEMTVLAACGYSRGRLLGDTLGYSLVVMALVAMLSLYLAPFGLQYTQRLQQMQNQLTELDLIQAGQFQTFDQGNRTTYAERISSSASGRQLHETFVAMRETEGSGGLRIMVAESARPVVDENSGRRFMELENGHYYEGQPGQADYQVTRFDAQGILLPERVDIAPELGESALPTRQLWGTAQRSERIELHWRLSMVVMIPVLAMIAVPLSRVSPRQGHFSRIVPATILYAVYFLLLQVVRERLDASGMALLPGLWWVHGLFLLLALILLSGGRPWRHWRASAGAR